MADITVGRNSVKNDDIVTTSKSQISDLWKKEDWLTIWIGAILIAVAAIAVITGSFDFSAAKFSTWGNGVSVLEQLGTGSFWISLVRTFLVTGALYPYSPLLCILRHMMMLVSRSVKQGLHLHTYYRRGKLSGTHSLPHLQSGMSNKPFLPFEKRVFSYF